MENKSKWKIVTSLFFSKIVDILLSAKTTLPTFLTNLGAPSWMLPLLVPIRESGSLLPQAFLGKYLQNKTNRQGQWRFSMVLQTLSIVIMFGTPYCAIYFGGGDNALLLGLIVLTSLALLSIARALTSLTMKDIQGKHIDKGRRGDLVGISSTCAGLLSLLFASVSLVSGKLDNDLIFIIACLSVVLMALSIFSMAGLSTNVESKSREAASSDTAHNNSGSPPLYYLLKIKSFLAIFRGSLGRFVLVRACFVHTALVAPFFIVWAIEQGEQNKWLSLSSFIIAQASAAILSSYAWGKISDKNARLTMQLGALTVFLVIGLVLYLKLSVSAENQLSGVMIVVLYFFLSLGHEGARAGRKVYALDIKSGADRTDFISKANSAIGVVLLTLGLCYSALSFLGNIWVMALMASSLVLGLLLSLGMSAEK
ncbi:MFS transporter permease [Glaciecola sp. MH2013]|nr:MFS transporter permease [Glaciecola sp. MH2013]